MKAKIRLFVVVGLLALSPLLVARAPAAMAATGEPQVPPPDPLPVEADDDDMRAHLIALRGDICQDMELASSLILNTGVLTQFPPQIQAAAGLTIPELEGELTVCSPEDDSEKSTADLLNEVRKAEWLSKLHLTALEESTFDNPRLRPIDAEGSTAAFLRAHDVLILEMRHGLRGLTDGNPTLEDGQALGVFWTEVLSSHAQAEDEALFPLARAQGDKTLTGSATLIEKEHGPIEAGIDRYMETLAQVEAGDAGAESLITPAREVRAAVELHFGREEATVIRPLQERIDDVEFEPALAAQENAIGEWLEEHGWTPE